jgi:hypothetical protein
VRCFSTALGFSFRAASPTETESGAEAPHSKGDPP